MRRRLVGLFAVALLAAACTAGGGDDSKPAATVDPNAQHDPMTLTVWSNFSGREGKVTTKVLESVKQKYPWMTVKHVQGKDDEAIQRAINGGTPPDVAISFTPDNAARYCNTRAWQDLNPNLQAYKIDKQAMWPSAIFSYTQYNNIQCALPMLTDAYGLYYNVDLLQKAGFSEPPKTLSELTAMANSLAEFRDWAQALSRARAARASAEEEARQRATQLRIASADLPLDQFIANVPRELIELTECEAPYAANDNNGDRRLPT